MNRISRWLVAAATACALACSSASDSLIGTTPPGTFKLALHPIATIATALYVTAPAGDNRLFVVLQSGVISIIKNGALVATPFLDIQSSVNYAGSEEGLFSVAFHPNYASNGLFYVYFTDHSGNITIQRYHVSSNPDVADLASAHPIISFQHGVGNFGGLLAFGPDGKLYAGIGDGAGANTTGQDTSVYLGKMLRLDVDAADPYAIPSDNPYAGAGHGDAQPEIWAKGLRNPWRYTFDGATHRLYMADVGESVAEEISVVPSTQAGVNYGWPVMEGGGCFLSSTCVQTGLTLPVVTYTHAASHCAVIGGFVYRGSELPEIAGHYFYSDVCAGGINSFRYTAGNAVVDEISWSVGTTGHAQSFGRDGAGELYFVNNAGVISKLIRETTTIP